MDLLCYLYDGWEPRIRPAEPSRDWMDESPEAFAYRCLPLNIANAHGWEILLQAGFSAYWRGGPRPEDVILRLDSDMPAHVRPVALFGMGTVTLHIHGLFRTPPGWNLMVGGSPNRAKDGIAPLTGVIETDWSPYTFTMNWRFTRRNHWVRFDAGEPICFIQPVPRGALERMDPKFVAMNDAPEVRRQYLAWNASRLAFQADLSKTHSPVQSDRWQKRYYRGLDMDGRQGVPDHRARLRLKPFQAGKPSPAAPESGPLETAIAALAAAARDGTPYDPGLLTAAGLAPEAAARIVAAAGLTPLPPAADGA